MRPLPDDTGGDQRIRFHDLVFDADLLNALRDDGSTVRLSRKERALLRLFTSRIHRLLTRDQLMRALSDEPDETSDRNVDFLINRLRRKLRDPARAPRFISTQYGEGYTWIAPAQPIEPTDQFLVIGPVRGVADAAGSEPATRLLEGLRHALNVRTAPGRPVMLRPEWRAGTRGFRFSLEVSFLVDHGALQAALTLRDEADHRLIEVVRLPEIAAMNTARMDELAASLLGAIWRHLTVGVAGGAAVPTDEPLQLRMQGAAALLTTSGETWLGIEDQLVADRAARPEDPQVAIMWAMALFARLSRAEAGDPADPATYRRLEDEIEGLVFASLPALKGQTMFELAAAKLLICVHRGHAALAERIAEAALADSAAFGAALPVLAQARAARGDVDGALVRYGEALELCEPSSEFEIYLLLLACEALLAKGDRAGADAAFERAVRIKPKIGPQFGYMLLRPGEANLTPDQRRWLGRVKFGRARRAIGYQYYMIARAFGRPWQRANVMAGLLDHLVRRFGPEVVPEAVGEALPETLGAN